MAVIQVCDFGEVDGVKTYRVNGSKDALEKILAACYKEDATFDGTPELEHVQKNYWTLLLKIKVAVEVGGEG